MVLESPDEDEEDFSSQSEESDSGSEVDVSFEKIKNANSIFSCMNWSLTTLAILLNSQLKPRTLMMMTKQMKVTTLKMICLVKFNKLGIIIFELNF